MKEFENGEIVNTERREILAALMKYSAAVGGASTVVLSASEAVAQSAFSGGCTRGNPGNDKCVGNAGEQDKDTGASGGSRGASTGKT